MLLEQNKAIKIQKILNYHCTRTKKKELFDRFRCFYNVAERVTLLILATTKLAKII